MEFREMLQWERKSRGWSQEDLAEKIQVSRQAVSKWETGDAMPDLPKLLALADVLNISLDALCGRDVPSSQSAVPAESTPAPAADMQTVKPSGSGLHRLLAAICVFLAVCLVAAGVRIWEQKDYVPAEEAVAVSPLPDTFTVSGVGFHGQSDYRVAFQFTPSIAGENYTYQITFTNSDGDSRTFDAAYSGGVCSGVAVFDMGFGTYAVTVSVTDGVNSRNLAVAINLNFSETRASWTPLEDAS